MNHDETKEKYIEIENQVKLLHVENEDLVKSENTDKKCFINFQNKIKQLRGIIIGLVGAFFLSLSGILIKKTTIVTGSEQAVVRYLMQMFIMLIIAFYNKVNVFGNKDQRGLLLVRGCFGATAILSMSLSVKYIDPSDTQALHSTRLIMISILARIFLKEKLTIIHIICLFLTIAGVLLISQPSFLVENFSNFTIINQNETLQNNSKPIASYIGISLALLGGACASFVAILVKKLTDLKVHYSINILFSCYAGLPLAIATSLGMYFTNLRNINYSKYDTTSKLALQIFYLLCSALCGCIFQSLSVLSNRYETASKLAIVSTTNLFWSFLLQYLVLDIGANAFSASGALFIFLSVILSILIKILDKKLQKSSLREDERSSGSCLKILRKSFLFKF
jgi:drug/metabolite transporter (DMT)-like permease